MRVQLPPEVVKPFPPNWQELPAWIRLRIARLRFALPFCKGRAADLRPSTAKEIERLVRRLAEVTPRYDHIWFWKGSVWRPIYRKGERCRVMVRGSKNSVLVEFEDGFRTVTSRHAVRPAPALESTLERIAGSQEPTQVKNAVPKQAFDAVPTQAESQLTFFDE